MYFSLNSMQRSENRLGRTLQSTIDDHLPTPGRRDMDGGPTHKTWRDSGIPF